MFSALSTIAVVASLGAAGAPAQIAVNDVCRNSDSVGITRVLSSKPHLDSSGRNAYSIAVTATNEGKHGQLRDALDSIALVERGVRLDVKGLQSLPAGASQTVHFILRRAVEAGTSELHFQMLTKQGMDCNADADVIITI